MKKVTGVVAILVAVMVLAGAALAQNKYVGAKFCGSCHKQEKTGAVYLIW